MENVLWNQVTLEWEAVNWNTVHIKWDECFNLLLENTRHVKFIENTSRTRWQIFHIFSCKYMNDVIFHSLTVVLCKLSHFIIWLAQWPDKMNRIQLHDPVTRCGINYVGTQITQWDFCISNIFTIVRLAYYWRCTTHERHSEQYFWNETFRINTIRRFASLSVISTQLALQEKAMKRIQNLIDASIVL